MYTWFFTAAFISTMVIPSYGKIAAEHQRLEGGFRSREQALITNSEMVAFMGGEVPEVTLLEKSFDAIRYHLEYSLRYI